MTHVYGMVEGTKEELARLWIDTRFQLPVLQTSNFDGLMHPVPSDDGMPWSEDRALADCPVFNAASRQDAHHAALRVVLYACAAHEADAPWRVFSIPDTGMATLAAHNNAIPPPLTANLREVDSTACPRLQRMYVLSPDLLAALPRWTFVGYMEYALRAPRLVLELAVEGSPVDDNREECVACARALTTFTHTAPSLPQAILADVLAVQLSELPPFWSRIAPSSEEANFRPRFLIQNTLTAALMTHATTAPVEECIDAYTLARRLQRPRHETGHRCVVA